MNFIRKYCYNTRLDRMIEDKSWESLTAEQDEFWTKTKPEIIYKQYWRLKRLRNNGV